MTPSSACGPVSGPCRLSCLADGAQEFSPTPPAGLVRLGRTRTERAVTPGSVAPAGARESTRRFRVNTGLFVFGSLAPSGPLGLSLLTGKRCCWTGFCPVISLLGSPFPWFSSTSQLRAPLVTLWPCGDTAHWRSWSRWPLCPVGWATGRGLLAGQPGPSGSVGGAQESAVPTLCLKDGHAS